MWSVSLKEIYSTIRLRLQTRFCGERENCSSEIYVGSRGKSNQQPMSPTEKSQHFSLFISIIGVVLDCAAHGVPSPTITWQEDSGQPVSSGAAPGETGFLQVLAHNNSLWIRPFPAHLYRPSIHQAGYRCLATSESGRVLSRRVRVKAGRTTKHVQEETLNKRLS